MANVKRVSLYFYCNRRVSLAFNRSPLKCLLLVEVIVCMLLLIVFEVVVVVCVNGDGHCMC